MTQFKNIISSLVLLALLVSCASSERGDTNRRAKILYDKGTTFLMAKDYTSALKDLMAAAKLDPNNSAIHNNLGMAYYFKGNTELAQTHIRKAIDLDSKNSDALSNLANLYFEAGKFALAEKTYQRVLQDLTYNKQYRTYYNLGLLQLKQNNSVKAEGYFEKSVATLDSYCPAHFQLGLIIFNKGFYEEAHNSFLEASKGTCYNDPAPHYHQALSLMELKKYDQASRKFLHIKNHFPKTRFASQSQIQLVNLEKFTDVELERSIQARLERINKTNTKVNSPEF